MSNLPKKTRLKTPALVAAVPQNHEQATESVRRIGLAQREIQLIQLAMNDDMAVVREKYEAQALPLSQQVEALTSGLHTWAEANRDSLTQGGKSKTASLPSGELAWRLRPPSVRVTGADAVIAALRSFGLNRFIRTKDEVNKEAVLNEPQAVEHVPGISISQGEDFIVTPFEVELASAA